MRKSDAQKLKEAGLDDAAIVELVSVTAYFNFINRVALGLGVRLDEALEGAAEAEDLVKEEARLSGEYNLTAAFDDIYERVDDSVVIKRPCRNDDDEHENAQEQIFQQAVFGSSGFRGISFRHAVDSQAIRKMWDGLYC